MSDDLETEPDEPDLGPDVPDIAPDEPDPDLGPEIPDVSPSEGGFFGPEDTPEELLRAFWTLVVLFNVGLLATSLGVLVSVFEGRLYLGGGLLVAGLLALARGGYRYHRFDRESINDEDGEND